MSGSSEESALPGSRGHGSRPPHPRLILVNASFRAIADIGSKIATLALYLFVARKAGASEFGIFVFAISFAGIAVTLGQFGQEFVLVREVARDRGRLESLYSNVICSRLLLSIPPLLIALAVALAIGMSARTCLVILLMGLGFVSDYLVQVSFAVFQAYERVGLMPIVLITQRWLTTGAAVVLLYLGAGIVGVAAVYMVGAAMAALLAAALVYREIARPRLRFSVRGALRVTRVAVPIGLGLVALTFLARIDMIMLAAFKPSAQVGQYGAAYRILEATGFVVWSANTAVMPAMARLTRTSVPSVGAVYQRALKLVLAITLPGAAAAAILAGPIIALLYGHQYHAAAGALALLAPTITLAPASVLSSQLLYAQGIRRVVTITYAVVFVENVLLNLILIPRYSLDGAAAGTSISELLVASTLLYCSRELRGRLELPRMLRGAILATAVASGVFAALHAHLALALPAGAAVYLTVLLVHERASFPEDFAVLRSFLARLYSRGERPNPPPVVEAQAPTR